MSNYFLMHKDDICGSLILDDDDGKILAEVITVKGTTAKIKVKRTGGLTGKKSIRIEFINYIK